MNERESEERQARKERSVNEIVHIDNALNHFGISSEEAFSNTLVLTSKNGNFFRKELGIDICIGEIERFVKKDVRKARIIIDYDADFPVIVERLSIL